VAHQGERTQWGPAQGDELRVGPSPRFTVLVGVAAPVIVAVHLNGNATVGVIGPRKLARIELAGSVPAMQRELATVPDAMS
jgi:hypothetical protein